MIGNILSTTQQVVVLAILMLVGFVCGKVHLFDDDSIACLSSFALRVVGPSAIIYSFCRPFDAEKFRAILMVVLIGFCFYVVSVILAFLLIRGGKDSTRRVLRYGTVFANCGYMGMPLQQALYGADGLFYAASWQIIYNLVAWTFGLFLMSGNKKEISFGKLIKNPGIIAVGTGMIIFVCSIGVPQILLQPIGYLANLNVPIPMVICGYYLSKADLHTIWRHPNYYMTILLRLIVLPLIFIGLLMLTDLNDMMLVCCIVNIAPPVAAATTMFSVLYKQDSETAANLVSISTLLSIITLPVMIALAQSVFS